jgi:ABC-type nitrate/sulfonate/bicarbonate transport system permease component
MSKVSQYGWVAFAKALPLIAILLIWELVAHGKNEPRLFPSLEYVAFVSLPSLGVFSTTNEPGFVSALSVIGLQSLITIARILGALAVGIPAGVLFGLTIHYLRGASSLSAISLMVIRSIPLLALIPLFAFWFGTSQVGILAYIAFGVFVVVSSDSYESAANLSPVYVQQARLLGGRQMFLVSSVYMPGTAISLYGSLRNVLGLSWALALGAEYVSASSGLGYIVYQSYLYSDMGKMAVLACVYIILGYVAFELGSRLFIVLAPWAVQGGQRKT